MLDITQEIPSSLSFKLGKEGEKSLPRIYFLAGVAIILVYFLLAALYSLIVPPFEAPDEPGHFYYIFHLITQHTLPDQYRSNDGEAHQPPLYYLIAALPVLKVDLRDSTGAFHSNPRSLFSGGGQINEALHGSAETFPFQGQALGLHLARLVSVFMGAGTVFFILSIGWKLFPAAPFVGLTAAALVAFNPQFLFISSVINNDNLLILAATATWSQMIRALETPEKWRHWVILGLLSSIAILAKINGIVVLGMTGLVLVYCSISRRSFRMFLCGILAIGLPVTLISGWWFLRNQFLYGDPIGWKVYQQIFSVNQRLIPLTWKDLADFMETQFHSFWGVFGWMSINAPMWFYTGIKFLLLVSTVGLGFFIGQGSFSYLGKVQKTVIILYMSVILIQQVFILAIIAGCNSSCYQGRYLFPVIGPLMLLVSLGLASLIPQRIQLPILAGLALVLAGSASLLLFGVIKPAYQTAALPKSSLRDIPNKVDFDFGNQIALRGFNLYKNPNKPTVTLKLYWQVIQSPKQNFNVVIRLLDHTQQPVFEKRHIPGKKLKSAPITSLPGDIIGDTINITLPPSSTSGPYSLEVALIDPSNEEYLSLFQNGAPLNNFANLGQLPDY